MRPPHFPAARLLNGIGGEFPEHPQTPGCDWNLSLKSTCNLGERWAPAYSDRMSDKLTEICETKRAEVAVRKAEATLARLEEPVTSYPLSSLKPPKQSPVNLLFW